MHHEQAHQPAEFFGFALKAIITNSIHLIILNWDDKSLTSDKYFRRFDKQDVFKFIL